MFRPKNNVGLIGEETATKFLMKQGFSIRERNYWKKWGEIDIVAQKDGLIHFIEVKTVSCENLDLVLKGNSGHNPEDNIHPWKLKRLGRVIQSYLLEKNVGEGKWQLDSMAVFIEESTKRAKIRMIENIVL